MGRARASLDLPVPASAAEELWYDLTRWSSFVDGFAHVAKVEGEWPRVGARLQWDSLPNGRGRVVERVVRFEVRAGQEVAVEDPRITGTQTVTFTPVDARSSRIGLELEYELKERTPLSGLVDVLFVRRAFNDALARTLSRFRREARADAELLDATR